MIRNNGRNGGIQVLHQLGDYSTKLHQDITLIKRKCHKITKVIWHKPDKGWVKLNTDGSFKDNKAAAGGLIRDHEGEFLSGFTYFIGMGSAVSAELIGILRGIEICKQNNWNKIWIETDATVALQLIQRGGEDWTIVQKIRNLLADVEYKISHIYREGNRAADMLAKKAWKERSCTVFDINYSLNCRKLIHQDKLGIINLRIHV